MVSILGVDKQKKTVTVQLTENELHDIANGLMGLTDNSKDFDEYQIKRFEQCLAGMQKAKWAITG